MLFRQVVSSLQKGHRKEGRKEGRKGVRVRTDIVGMYDQFYLTFRIMIFYLFYFISDSSVTPVLPFSTCTYE